MSPKERKYIIFLTKLSMTFVVVKENINNLAHIPLLISGLNFCYNLRELLN